jgi:hypothetical protein
MDIKAGDVVELEGAESPLMNVRSTSRISAFCTWLDHSGTRHVGVFLLSELKLRHELAAPEDWESRWRPPHLH